MNQSCPCPIEKLKAFLDGAIDTSLHSTLLEHLDQCEACRKRLEADAGSDDDWNTARLALSSLEVNLGHGVEIDSSLIKSQTNRSMIDPLVFLQMLAPSDDPRAAGKIGSFEITGIIGSGGMGLVLKARDPALDRFVAIKMLAPHLAKSQSARKRFAREARAAAAVIHDNVLQSIKLRNGMNCRIW